MRTVISVAALALCAGFAAAQPTNTTLPGGWSWQPLSTGSYDTGLVGTERGGFDTQASPPFNDTSFGVMDEIGTPWFTGNDLSAQQYVQRQIFGNFGTSSPPGPSGARFYNFGYGGTTAGSNFPRSATERRTISLAHWNNSAPDAGGIASFGQVVRVPVAATLVIGMGYGADEMLLKVIGGNSGGRSEFFVEGTLNAAFSTTAFGIATVTGRTNVNAVVQANNAGPGSYDVAWGFGATNQSQVNIFRVGADDAVFENNAYVGEPTQGIPANSVGTSITRTYNVLSSLVQTGGTFNIDFAATADISRLNRNSGGNGNADARAQMGPGMEGNARLVVQWAEFRAVPTPGALALLGLGGLVAARRRR